MRFWSNLDLMENSPLGKKIPKISTTTDGVVVVASEVDDDRSSCKPGLDSGDFSIDWPGKEDDF